MLWRSPKSGGGRDGSALCAKFRVSILPAQYEVCSDNGSLSVRGIVSAYAATGGEQD